MHKLLGMAGVAAAVFVGSARADLSVVSGMFTVDRLPPEPPQLTSPVFGAVIEVPSVSLAAHAVDATSGVAGYRFELNGVASDWQTAGTWQATNLTSGRQTWRAQARDAAGHEGPWSGGGEFFHWPGEDTDDDGLSDAWELYYFGSLDFTDGTADSDGDGVTDTDEYAMGTHPFEFYLALDEGWNILALSFDATAAGLAALRTLSPAPFWGWNGANYMVLTLPKAYEGFWAYIETATVDVPISGLPTVETCAALAPAWSLAGAGYPCRALNPALVWIGWGWNADQYEMFTPDGLFGAFQGYWLYTRNGGLLEFGPPEDE